MKVDQLGGLSVFAAAAKHMNFRAAADELRVSPSAVSQAIAQLESNLGVRLFHRTTRNVQLTEEGRRFHEFVRPLLTGLAAAFDDVRSSAAGLSGCLRLHIPRAAFDILIASRLAEFQELYPGLVLDFDLEPAIVDIVEKGYDAGLRLGEYLDADVIGVKMSDDLRAAVVASPEYFAKHGRPTYPQDLKSHDCINFRYFRDQTIYNWEFENRGRKIKIKAGGKLILNDSGSIIDCAVRGLGVAYVLDAEAERLVADGKLERVLDDCSPRFPGFYLYYPSRRHMARKLRAFVEFFSAAGKRPVRRKAP